MRVAALAAAFAAAAFLPGHPLGVGALVVAGLVALAAWRSGVSGGRVTLYGALALALASMVVVRDAGWVVALDLMGAWVLASVAVSGATVASLAAPLVRLRDASVVVPPAPPSTAPAARGALFGGLVAVPFGALFWTADAAFAEATRSLPLPSLVSVPGRVLSFALVLAAALGLALAVRRPLVVPPVRVPSSLGLLEWAIPLALLDALFAAFVGVQFAVFFGGHGHVLETAGLTYAEYARQGFWELLGASALTLVVVGGVIVLAQPRTLAERRLRAALLGLLCALTLVVLVSALRRLALYEDTFGLTRLRLGAQVVAFWLGGFFALVIAAGLVSGIRRRLVPATVVGSAVALLAFSLANPDGLVAGRNVQRWRGSGRIDVRYLRGLSADAAPALSGLPAALRAAALAPLVSRLERGEPWSSFNLSRRRAREIAGA
jgi:hypothetical protein